MTQSDNISIRSYRQEDASALLSIYTPYILDGPYTFETAIPSLDSFLSRLKEISDKYPFYILEKNESIIGYAYACAHRERAAYRWAVETSIYINQNSIGKGYGKQLYQTLLQTLKKRHFTHAFALIGMPNDKSIALHESCGFTEQSIHKNAGWKNGKWIDVYWMHCALEETQEFPEEPIFMPSSMFA
jgi:phosphinothricin acetyltransferase